ncbi:hypothetical protein DFO73_101680 [Cytobacillus oceanisediminis]|uniref:Uncharacterized protein n=1 Tax=Cytobacillus oceanisediminis TaxID=665099 RepID=A0A2V3A6L0_9BACI|nr:hypothetical protein DFO73_101680 [Cytobacillus oceanisediminis]
MDLAVALAAFSFSASAALTVLIVFAALTVLGAAVAVVIAAAAVAAAVVAVASLINHASFIKILAGHSKGKPLQLHAGAFLLKGRHMRQIPVHRIIEKGMFHK